MKITEAKQKLMQLAEGQYHSLEYSITDTGRGSASQKCKVYIDGHGSFEAPHWEAALSGLEEVINGRPAISEDLPLSGPAEDITTAAQQID